MEVQKEKNIEKPAEDSSQETKVLLEEHLQRPATPDEIINSTTDTFILVKLALQQIVDIKTLLEKNGIV